MWLTMKILTHIRNWELATRPVLLESRSALDRRWAELPEHVKTPNQILGKFAVGCEGTHGVFPKCNMTCSPCYHSADANKVPIDGQHTQQNVKAQMKHLRHHRGPRAHAQLIGGEVSLLSPEDHAITLIAMREAGREPMSMTHGDFDYEYLSALALDKNGKPRFTKLSFAAHFDSLMRGRRGIVRPRYESELTPYREQFAAMFKRLKSEHGIKSYLAHNMMVTPSNLSQVAEVTTSLISTPFDMLSFQPAAYIGDERRWDANFSEISIDAVWSQIEEGVGRKLPWSAIQFGDPRCNRTMVAIQIEDSLFPLLDPENSKDLVVRDLFLKNFGGMIIGGTPPLALAIKLLRHLASHPKVIIPFLDFIIRSIQRAGGLIKILQAGLKKRIAFKTFVVHNFMDAADVKPAWEMMESGLTSSDPKILETQERLRSCMYTMSHPETNRLIPACVQHSVLDPGENLQLLQIRGLGNSKPSF
jgi:hypothetical protein